MAGYVFLCIALLTSVGAALCFFFGGERAALFGKKLACASLLSVFAASVSLMVFILTDRFDIAYVAGYSSKDLPLVYKVSSFWAGQEGSFLLWLLIHAAAGAWLAFSGKMKRGGLFVFLSVEVVLTALVLLKSPFRLLDAAALDGVGLNPLLQDPWMAVHPPIVFAGYALLAVPFAYGCGALIERDAKTEWMNAARRWALAAWAFLGAGIFIGGYWAYKVLGWGGYWGWDPVENSSLVPWLMAGVFIHVLRTARLRPAAIPMVHLSAIFTYALVLYGTFLTRSGVLGDFSVHSFSGTSIGLLLAVVDGMLLLAGLILLIARSGSLPQGALYPSHASREFFLLLGSLLLVFAAAIVFLGMSMPLLTQLVGAPAAIHTDFYVRTLMPLAIFMMIVAGLGVLKRYGDAQDGNRLGIAVGGFVVGAAAAAWIGLRTFLPILLAGASIFAAVSSATAWRCGRMGTGGCIAHLGLGFGLFAVVLSGSASQTVSHEFLPGTPQEIFGRSISYEGQRFAEDGLSKRYVFRIDGDEASALTKLHANGEDAAREPAIYHFAAGDVYIAPSPASAARKEILLSRGKVWMDASYAYRYASVAFDEPSDGTALVSAEIEVTDGERVEHVKPQIRMTRDGGTSKPVEIFGGAARIRLTGVSDDRRRIRAELLPSLDTEQSMAVTASVSTKPVIWLLWLSAAFVTAGCFVAAKEL